MNKKQDLVKNAIIPTDAYPYNIPDTWIWCFSGSIADIVSGGTPKTSFDEYFTTKDEGIPWVTPADLSNYEDIYIVKGERSITKLGLSKSSAKLMPANTVLFSSRAPIGYVAIAKNEITTNQGFKNFVLPSKVSPEYLYYFLKHNKKSVEQMATGTTFKEVSAKTIKKLPIPIPPFQEQIRIVNKLKMSLNIIGEAKNKIIQAKALIKKRHEALINQTFNSSNFNEWDYKELDEVAEIISGYAFKKQDFIETNGIKSVKITNVGVREFINNQTQNLPEEFNIKYSSYVVEENNILIALTRPYIKNGLKVCFYPLKEKSLLNQRVAAIKIKDNFLLKYIYYFLTSKEVLEYVKSFSKASSQPNLSIKSLKSLSIPIPPYEKLVEKVKKIEGESIVEKQILEKLEEAENHIEKMHESLLRKAFRGELVEQRVEEGTGLDLFEEIIEEKLSVKF